MPRLPPPSPPLARAQPTPWPAKRSRGSWAPSPRPGGLRGWREPTSSGVMAPPLERRAPTACSRATWPLWRPWHRAGPRRVADLSPSARQAGHWRTALMRGHIGLARRVRMQQPHAGWHSSGRCACLSRTVASPARCPRHGARWPVRSSTASPPCSCRPLLLPDRHARWTPVLAADRAAWWASSTPGPETWPPIRLSLTSSLVGPCHPRACRGSHPALQPGLCRSARAPGSAGARAQRR